MARGRRGRRRAPKGSGEDESTNVCELGNVIENGVNDNPRNAKPCGEQGFAAAPNVLQQSDFSTAGGLSRNFDDHSAVPGNFNQMDLIPVAQPLRAMNSKLYASTPIVSEPNGVVAPPVGLDGFPVDQVSPPVFNYHPIFQYPHLFSSCEGQIGESRVLRQKEVYQNVRSKASPFPQTTKFEPRDSVNNFSSVAPAFHAPIVVSQQSNYSVPVFYTSVNSHLLSNQMPSSWDSAFGIPNSKLIGHGQSFTENYNPGYRENGNCESQTISAQRLANCKGDSQVHTIVVKEMDVPTYGGVSDSKDPNDYVAELNDYQNAIGYSDYTMLYRIVSMSLFGEAYQWFRSVTIPFSDFAEFKRRLSQRYRVVYGQEHNNIDSSVASAADLRVVSHEYSAYPGDETNMFPLMQPSYGDHEARSSGAQSSF